LSKPESDRMLVEKGSIARCTWCGSPENDGWIFSISGEPFCSSECKRAASIRTDGEQGAAFIAPGLFFFLLSVRLVDLLETTTMVLIPFLGLLCGLPIFVCGSQTIFSTREAMKYYNRKNKYRDVTLLQCEYSTQANPPNVVRCQYCGASLTKAPFKYETTPPWIRAQMHLGRFKCPHCGATYSYDVAKLENDGIIKCQNCNRSFIVPFPIAQ
jgi:predicted Zn finger-like uncharacterized protein